MNGIVSMVKNKTKVVSGLFKGLEHDEARSMHVLIS